MTKIRMLTRAAMPGDRTMTQKYRQGGIGGSFTASVTRTKHATKGLNATI